MVKKKQDSKIQAFIATFLSIIGFFIALLAWKKDRYTMFYAKQSLVIFITAVIAWLISAIIGWIPILGWAILAALNILVVTLWALTWINALSGKQKYTWLVGAYADKINL